MRATSFRFELGQMRGLDRARREIMLEPVIDAGGAALPGRRLGYDTLVIAVGSVLNDFGVPGVREHCLYLDSPPEAERIHQQVSAAFCAATRRPARPAARRLRFAVVGAGATGVEFAAELRHAARQLVGYGLRGFDPDRDIEVRLIEAAPSVLPALPERLQEATERALRDLGVEIHTGEQVERVTAEGVHTRSGRLLPADLTVWTAGVKGPAWLADLDGLEVNRLNQLVVDQTLKVTRDEHIFALGDCAACPQPGSDRPVPPRAQAAHQQAHLLARSLARRLEGKAPLPFVYKDYGSLISLSSSSIGNLMGNLFKSITIEGFLARLAYLSLYKKHQVSLHGLSEVTLMALANLLDRRRDRRSSCTERQPAPVGVPPCSEAASSVCLPARPRACRPTGVTARRHACESRLPGRKPRSRRRTIFSTSRTSMSRMPAAMITMPSPIRTGRVSNSSCMNGSVGEGELRHDHYRERDQHRRRAQARRAA